jgi:hypothetical protein
MSPIKPAFERVVPALRRAASRVRGGHAVALSVLVAAAFGLAGLRAVDLPGPRPISDSDRLRIEVVHPVEPDIVAGSVMDVGELVDGFQGLPPPLPPLTDAAWSYDDGWDDHEPDYSPSRPEARRVAGVRTYESAPPPERTSPVRAVQRWFGFDAPRRDFRAERAARRARMEAMERDARERRARERYAHDRYRRERAEDERHARERLRQARVDYDRYAWDRGREPDRDPPWRRDDRLDDGEYERGHGPVDAQPDREPAPPPPGPRPYSEWGR